jgi:hypothetical protein
MQHNYVASFSVQLSCLAHGAPFVSANEVYFVVALCEPLTSFATYNSWRYSSSLHISLIYLFSYLILSTLLLAIRHAIAQCKTPKIIYMTVFSLFLGQYMLTCLPLLSLHIIYLQD